MKAKKIRILLAACLCLALLVMAQRNRSTQTENPVKQATLQQFTERIREVEDEAKTYKGDYNLYVLPGLKRLTNEAPQNIDACLQFVALPDLTRRQRSIALMSMSDLEFDQKAAFIDELVKLVDAGRLLPWHLTFAVFPPPGQSAWIILHYRDPRVVSLLTTLAAKPDAEPHLKFDVEKTLSGEAVSDLLYYWRIEFDIGRSSPNPFDVLTAIWLLATGIWLPYSIAVVSIGLVGLAAGMVVRRRVRRT